MAVSPSSSQSGSILGLPALSLGSLQLEHGHNGLAKELSQYGTTLPGRTAARGPQAPATEALVRLSAHCEDVEGGEVQPALQHFLQDLAVKLPGAVEDTEWFVYVRDHPYNEEVCAMLSGGDMEEWQMVAQGIRLSANILAHPWYGKQDGMAVLEDWPFTSRIEEIPALCTPVLENLRPRTELPAHSGDNNILAFAARHAHSSSNSSGAAQPPPLAGVCSALSHSRTAPPALSHIGGRRRAAVLPLTVHQRQLQVLPVRPSLAARPPRVFASCCRGL